MQPVVIYEINQYIETSGKFFLLQYVDAQPHTREVCRVYMGCKGPATLSLDPHKMAFCYLGDAYQTAMILEPTNWTLGEDDIKEFDCISFLRKHQIPYKIDYCYEGTRKAEKYLSVSGNGYLGEKGLLDVRKYHSEGKNYNGSAWEKNEFWVSYYPKYGNLYGESKEELVSYFRGVYTIYKPMKKSYFVKAFRAVDQGEIRSLLELKKLLPEEKYRTEYHCFKKMSQGRGENHVCRDSSYDLNIKNALVLKPFVKEAVNLYLAFPVSEYLAIPCRVKLYGKNREVEIPWQTDIHNTYLIYCDWEKNQYFFQPLLFELDENGMPVFEPQIILEKFDVKISIQTKAECRKCLNRIEDCYQLISGSEQGFILGSSVRYSFSTPNFYSTSQYLKDCKICGKKLFSVKHGSLDSYDSNKTLWLPEKLEQLFRFGGELTEEMLLSQGKNLFTLPNLMLITEVGSVLIDCHGANRKGKETIKFLKDKELDGEVIEKGCVIREEDVTDLDCVERAKVLIAMLNDAS